MATPPFSKPCDFGWLAVAEQSKFVKCPNQTCNAMYLSADEGLGTPKVWIIAGGYPCVECSKQIINITQCIKAEHSFDRLLLIAIEKGLRLLESKPISAFTPFQLEYIAKHGLRALVTAGIHEQLEDKFY